MSCRDCRYFDPDKAPGSDRGFCRRRAPIYALTSTLNGEPMPWTCWPEVNGEDWCGEFKPHAPTHLGPTVREPRVGRTEKR